MKSLSKNRQEREHRVFQDEAVTCPMPEDVRKEYILRALQKLKSLKSTQQSERDKN